jgi:regulator of cell morphogenesis and NO signaling
MIDPLKTIDENAFVPDIVGRDYRTADIFRKHGIDYCCRAGWSLKTACEMKGIEVSSIKKDLEEAIRTRNISGALPFTEWPLDFLVDYIVHVHHGYIRQTLPGLKEHLDKFVTNHRKKHPYLDELQEHFLSLCLQMPMCMQQEEEIIFPYIRYVHRAHSNKESFASLLTRTLRKPVDKVMNHEYREVTTALAYMRTLTNNYTPDEHACASHWVVFLKLRELDDDLVQHMHLEHGVILPQVLAIERALNKT